MSECVRLELYRIAYGIRDLAQAPVADLRQVKKRAAMNVELAGSSRNKIVEQLNINRAAVRAVQQ